MALEKAKEFRFQLKIILNKDWSKNEIFEAIEELHEKHLSHQQPTLTLDSKVDDEGNVLDEPRDWYNWNDTLNPHTQDKDSIFECQQYQQAKTIKQRLANEKALRDVVTELAEWSKKYPRGRVYPMSKKSQMDGELISIEEKAKQLLNQ